MQAYILDKTSTEMTILTSDARFLRIPICAENPEFIFAKTIFTPKKLLVCFGEYERTRFRKRAQYNAKIKAAAAALCKLAAAVEVAAIEVAAMTTTLDPQN